jgi:putative hydrolase of the HAD superfamily
MTSAGRFDALVFDFGGPVLRTGFELVPALERRVGLPLGTYRRRGPFDPAGDRAWRRLQAGEITEPNYWRGFAAELADTTRDPGLRGLMRALYDLPEADLIRPEAQLVLDAAKSAGLRTGVLTNDLALFHDSAWIEGIEFLKAVDAVVDGSVTGVLKPDPGAYQAIAWELDVAMSRMAFVDDQPRNVAGARAVGVTAVLFDVTRPAESFRELARLTGLPFHAWERSRR